ncbi:Uncharacterised protein [Arcanobacterium haemolyticum]|nr:Uncharacterised protein [Arcanobacterium haemolyticum]SQH28464.1 Uncharacterised protein [Arcanobacterium haemolyticum]
MTFFILPAGSTIFLWHCGKFGSWQKERGQVVPEDTWPRCEVTLRLSEFTNLGWVQTSWFIRQRFDADAA